MKIHQIVTLVGTTISTGIVLFIIYLMFFYKSPPRETVREFHVKVVCYSEGKFDSYKIVFTKDNFETEEDINRAFDISVFYPDVNHNTAIFRSKAAAIDVAKRLQTFQICLQYNDSVRLAYDSINAAVRKTFVLPQSDIDCIDGFIVY